MRLSPILLLYTYIQVAIKIIEIDKIKEEYVKKNLLREAQLMRRLRHPNIIRLYETMKTNTLYCLVTEVAEGGELLSHVRNDCPEKRLTEGSARMFVRQLISALDYLHNAGIVHRWVHTIHWTVLRLYLADGNWHSLTTLLFWYCLSIILLNAHVTQRPPIPDTCCFVH